MSKDDKGVTVSLSVDEIPELLYDYLLEEFQDQHGFDGVYVEWKITAIKKPLEGE